MRLSAGHCPRPDRRGGIGHVPGFTLVELSVVLVIVALLVGSVLTPLATRHHMRQNMQAEHYLGEVRDALIGFAVTQGRLPWPDTDMPPDGVENPAPRALPSCAACEGLLPWRTIGSLPVDPWGRVCRYRVAQAFTFPVQTGSPPGPNRFDLYDRGDIRIHTRADGPPGGAGGPSKKDIVLSDDAAAIVVSTGRNGAGGRRLDGAVVAAPRAHTDESINADGADTGAAEPHFYARPMVSPGPPACSDSVEGAPYCEFDDLVVWIPSSVLIKRMLDAGRLP